MFAAINAARPQEKLPGRDGLVEMAGDEFVSLAKAVTSDGRFKALRRVAKERHLSFENTQMKGFVFPEGYRAILVPVVDEKGRDSGFLVSSGESWSLSLTIRQGKKQIPETFSGKFGQDGEAVVEAGPTPKESDIDNEGNDELTINSVAPTTSCAYVSKLGFNFGCWIPNSNPFGYYYVETARHGTTPDPRSPSWWACYRGAIHICPRFEAPGSPYNFPVCGFPPPHPLG
jgi:hypothetical protein